MTKRRFSIDQNKLAVVRDHIAAQFANKSWWPAEGPRQAEEEFETMKHSPDRLTDWCVKWLDGSQWRELQKAVDRASAPPQSG